MTGSKPRVSALPPVVVGAGPAGARAAATLVAHGLAPVVIDEARVSGGQIYRRQPAGFTRPPAALYGTQAHKACALHRDFDALAGAIDYRPNTLVWNAEPGVLALWNTLENRTSELPWQDIIVATGATDRILPVPGWTLPGVHSLGGAQVALKFQACSIGQRVVFAGTGPLLYLVAYQYAKAGAKVAAVIDNARFFDQIAALPNLARQPATLAQGAYFVAWLQAHGVPVIRNARVTGIIGTTHVQAIAWTGNAQRGTGAAHTIECDALAFGYALRSETQLPDLLDCEFEFDPLQRAHLPTMDGQGRASQQGVYLAGDGAGIMGADAAELAGERAALALISDRNIAFSADRAAAIGKRLAGVRKWRAGMESAFPFPNDWGRRADDAVVICRCENITAGELRETIRQTRATELNRLKALSRVCMGRCQGRMCSSAAAEVLSAAIGVPIHQVGRLRAQAPIKPIPMNVQIEDTAMGDAP